MAKRSESIYNSTLNLQGEATMTLTAEERMMICEALSKCAPKAVLIDCNILRHLRTPSRPGAVDAPGPVASLFWRPFRRRRNAVKLLAAVRAEAPILRAVPAAFGTDHMSHTLRHIPPACCVIVNPPFSGRWETMNDNRREILAILSENPDLIPIALCLVIEQLRAAADPASAAQKEQ